ncbi:MAG: helix-turn-helix transcriptional regulator [Lachnospiraceae bacterium]|nr:helix-turn-helix transcriptional regulator [Lachnospiraceae bacterium]
MINTKEYTDDIVRKLTAERKKQKITQQQIADLIGMKAPNVTRVEACKHITSLDVILKYADAVGKKIVITIEDK